MWTWIRRAYYLIACMVFGWQVADILIQISLLFGVISGLAITAAAAMWIGNTQSEMINANEPMDKDFNLWLFIMAVLAASVLNIMTVFGYTYVNASIEIWTTALVAPVFEELIFRSWIWNRITTIGKKLKISSWHSDLLAFIVTTTTFWLIHIPSWGWEKTVWLLPISVFLGLLRLRTQGVFTSTAAHAAFNLTNIILRTIG